MTALSQAALLCAFVLTAGAAPAGPAHGPLQDLQDTFVRTFPSARGSRIGVTVRDLEEAPSTDLKSGVVIDAVDRGGPGDEAGLKTGDTIVEFDGERVRSVRQFQRLVQETPAGRTVGVIVSRAGQRETVKVTTEPGTAGDEFGMRLLGPGGEVRPTIPPTPPAPALPRAAPVPPAPFDFDVFTGRNGPLTIIAGRTRLGITTEALSGQLAQYFGVKDGALVTSVQDGSAAAKAGLKAGDVITSINGSRVYDSSDVSRTVNRLDEGAEFTIDVTRDHKTQTLKGTIEASTRRRSGVRTF